MVSSSVRAHGAEHTAPPRLGPIRLGRWDTWVHGNLDPLCGCGNSATKYFPTEMKLLNPATWKFYCPPRADEHERATGERGQDIPPKMIPH